MLQQGDARAAHAECSTAARHTAHKPLARVLALSKFVTNAANEVLLQIPGAIRKCNERMALWTMRRIVHIFGANGLMFIDPIGGKIDRQ